MHVYGDKVQHGGFAMHVHGDKALDLFDQMKQQGSANLITLLHFELFH
jgi:hypothetical protein